MDNLFLQAGRANALTDAQIEEVLAKAVASCPGAKKVLLLPPDITRSGSYAGPIARMLCRLLPDAKIDIMPALGTHAPMTDYEIEKMYGLPKEWFLVHRWRDDVVKIGEVPAEYISEISEGLMNVSIPVEVNRAILDPSYNLIISIGQVVPHEVAGMANYNKNIFVGCGGSSMINYSHYLGALFGMERVMGRDHSPVHKTFDYATRCFISHLPIMYVLTVTGVDEHGVHVKSISAGSQRDLFSRQIEVSQQHNLNFLDTPLHNVVAYLDPEKFHTTWLGNKAIYRTRMAMADGGQLTVIAPGVQGFGEDPTNDTLIRKYGYFGRDKVLSLTEANADLRENLSVAAHLIHGSSDGRFNITYAAGGLTQEEVTNAGFQYMPIDQALAKYDVNNLKDGANMVNGEEFFFIKNPAAGLWACRDRFC
ncbi:MAG: lactate racemase domain-containing protein [Defluviitaleaceae bacterium]|nr:lactate racemase domain-containing protein [Defluviitaleaceae bacterium]